MFQPTLQRREERRREEGARGSVRVQPGGSRGEDRFCEGLAWGGPSRWKQGEDWGPQFGGEEGGGGRRREEAKCDEISYDYRREVLKFNEISYDYRRDCLKIDEITYDYRREV